MVCTRGKENAESGNISSFQLACPRNHSILGLVSDILYRIWYSVFCIRLGVTDKVGTTPHAGIAAVYRSGHQRISNYENLTSFFASNLLLLTVTVQVNQATLSFQIELISHMHIWRQSVSGPVSKLRTCHITIHTTSRLFHGSHNVN